jgi:transporter family-2 protein
MFLEVEPMIGFFIAILSGALMSVQGVFNTQVTKASGIWITAAFVQFTALIVCVGAWLMTERTSLGSLLSVQPKYMLFGGVIGAFITFTVIRGMEQLGPARAVMFIVVSQLLVAYAIELLGWFGVEKQPWEWRKAIGMGIMIVGVVVFKFK